MVKERPSGPKGSGNKPKITSMHKLRPNTTGGGNNKH